MPTGRLQNLANSSLFDVEVGSFRGYSSRYVVIAAEEFRRLEGNATGRALVDAFRASPHREIDLTPDRSVMPVRRVAI
jgi:hypothetical protein